MRLLAKLRRFAGATKGLAALEFAILAPMMVLALFGAIDLIDLVGANRRAQNVAASLADVVSRDTSVTSDEIASLWAATGVLMFPDNGDDVRVRITSVSINGAGTPIVVWSQGRGLTARTSGSTVTLPAGAAAVGSSVILAETEYDYLSPLGILLAGPLTVRHDAWRRSRLVDPIPCTWSGCT